MENPSNKTSSNEEHSSEVVALADFRKKEKSPQSLATQVQDPLFSESVSSFSDIMKRNEELKEKMKKDRLKSNKAVLKSYRIKN